LKPQFICDLSDEEANDEQRYFRAEVYLDDGGQDYDIMGYTVDNIMNDVIDQYSAHLHFIQDIKS
jgi:choline/glycine/proline betaine transport protein